MEHRKRSRQSLDGSDEAADGIAHSSAASTAKSDCSSSSSSSAESTSDDPADSADDCPKPQLGALLVQIVRFLRPGETVTAAQQRYCAEKDASFSMLSQACHDLLVHYDKVVLDQTREVLIEEVRRNGSADVDPFLTEPLWMLRWCHQPSTEYGPYPSRRLRTWAEAGYFSKRLAEVRNIHAADPRWEAAAEVSF
jgi:hypothetical protein